MFLAGFVMRCRKSLRWRMHANTLPLFCIVAACTMNGPGQIGTGSAPPGSVRFTDCRNEYAAMDARVAAAGVGDAAYYRVPQFPYLRTDRFLASFRHEINGVNQTGDWIRRMRELDQEAREYEYINLGMSVREAATQRFLFLNCGRVLAGQELDSPEGLSRLAAAVQPPDEYSTLNRILGIYPLAVPAMRSQLESEQRTWISRFNGHGDVSTSANPLRLWSVKPREDLSLVDSAFARAIRDELGTPGLVDSEWRAFAEYYAPRLWVETAGEADVPAAPRLNGDKADADPDLHQVNYWISYTRFGGRALVQISYFIWFKGAQSTADGQLDGLIWRVTLDPQGRALVYESLHETGSEHRWFPVQPELHHKSPGYWQDPPFVAPELSPPLMATLRLGAGNHEVQQVLRPDQVQASDQHQYELRPYEDLFTLPIGQGATRSLFDPQGRIKGVRHSEPLEWLASGLRDAGTLRQYGHHAIARIGRSHFDDPFLLDSVFIAPQADQQLALSPLSSGR
jgi:hypothetical protein